MKEEKKLKYEDVKGIPFVAEAGNSSKKYMGGWRVFRPKINYSKCISCKICFAFCPDSAIKWKKEKPFPDAKSVGKPVFDFNMCKGCGLCWANCPVKAIDKIRDVKKEFRRKS
ncbi:MAG: 4Fe-4S binding protein [Candidatus Aenigmatarchaeota archaeon]